MFKKNKNQLCLLFVVGDFLLCVVSKGNLQWQDIGVISFEKGNLQWQDVGFISCIRWFVFQVDF